MTSAARHRRRRAAEALARADHIWPRERRFLSPEFVHDGTLLAAAEMLSGGVTCCNDQYFFPDAAARAYRRSGMRAMIGLRGARLSDRLRRRCGRLPASRTRGARHVEARAAAQFLACAACAVYRRRRKLGEDRRLCAAARSADPDAPAGNARRAQAKALPNTGLARCSASTGWASRARVHRRARRLPRRQPTSNCSRRRRATSCTARRRICKLASGIAPIAELRSARRQRRAGHRRRRKQQSSRRVRRSAPRGTDGKGATRRRGRDFRRPTCCAWRRWAARAPWVSTRDIGSLEPGKQADVDRRRPGRVSTRCPATTRFRTWFTSPAATR